MAAIESNDLDIFHNDDIETTDSENQLKSALKQPGQNSSKSPNHVSICQNEREIIIESEFPLIVSASSSLGSDTTSVMSKITSSIAAVSNQTKKTLKSAEERKIERDKKKEEKLIRKFQREEQAKFQPIAESKCKRYVKYDSKIGEGGYKVVNRGFDRDTCRDIAWCEVKREHLDSKYKRQEMFKEIDIMLKLDHPNVVKCYDVLTEWYTYGEDPHLKKNETRGVVLIQELMNEGTLKGMIKKNFQDGLCILENDLIIRWWYQILDVLRYMHTRMEPPIIHRDVKSDNLFLASLPDEDAVSVKIGDFGLATTINQNSQRKTMIGTIGFMAPEVYEEKYDIKVDIYAFGMMMLEVLTNKTPYDDCTNIMQVVSKSISKHVPDVIASISRPLTREIIMACVHPFKFYRPTAEELCEHPMFEKGSVIVNPVLLKLDRNDTVAEFVLNVSCSEELRNPIIDLNITIDPEYFGAIIEPGDDQIRLSLDVYQTHDMDITDLMIALKEYIRSFIKIHPKKSNQIDRIVNSIRLQILYLIKFLIGGRWRAIFNTLLQNKEPKDKQRQMKYIPTTPPHTTTTTTIMEQQKQISNIKKEENPTIEKNVSNNLAEYSRHLSLYTKTTKNLEDEIESYCRKLKNKAIQTPYFFNILTDNGPLLYSWQRNNSSSSIDIDDNNTKSRIIKNKFYVEPVVISTQVITPLCTTNDSYCSSIGNNVFFNGSSYRNSPLPILTTTPTTPTSATNPINRFNLDDYRQSCSSLPDSIRYSNGNDESTNEIVLNKNYDLLLDEALLSNCNSYQVQPQVHYQYPQHNNYHQHHHQLHPIQNTQQQEYQYYQSADNSPIIYHQEAVMKMMTSPQTTQIEVTHQRHMSEPSLQNVQYCPCNVNSTYPGSAYYGALNYGFQTEAAHNQKYIQPSTPTELGPTVPPSSASFVQTYNLKTAYLPGNNFCYQQQHQKQFVNYYNNLSTSKLLINPQQSQLSTTPYICQSNNLEIMQHNHPQTVAQTNHINSISNSNAVSTNPSSTAQHPQINRNIPNIVNNSSTNQQEVPTNSVTGNFNQSQSVNRPANVQQNDNPYASTNPRQIPSLQPSAYIAPTQKATTPPIISNNPKTTGLVPAGTRPIANLPNQPKVQEKSMKSNKKKVRGKYKYLVKVIEITNKNNVNYATFEMCFTVEQMRFTCRLSDEISTMEVSRCVNDSNPISTEVSRNELLENLVITVKKICQSLLKDISSVPLNEEYVFHPVTLQEPLIKYSDFVQSSLITSDLYDPIQMSGMMTISASNTPIGAGTNQNNNPGVIQSTAATTITNAQLPNQQQQQSSQSITQSQASAATTVVLPPPQIIPATHNTPTTITNNTACTTISLTNPNQIQAPPPSPLSTNATLSTQSLTNAQIQLQTNYVTHAPSQQQQQQQSLIPYSCTSSRSLSRQPSNEDLSITPTVTNTTVDDNPNPPNVTMQVPESMHATIKNVIDKLQHPTNRGIMLLKNPHTTNTAGIPPTTPTQTPISQPYKLYELTPDFIFVALPITNETATTTNNSDISSSSSHFTLVRCLKDRNFFISRRTVYQNPTTGCLLLQPNGEFKCLNQPSLILPSDNNITNSTTAPTITPKSNVVNNTTGVNNEIIQKSQIIELSTDYNQALDQVSSNLQNHYISMGFMEPAFDEPIILENEIKKQISHHSTISEQLRRSSTDSTVSAPPCQNTTSICNSASTAPNNTIGNFVPPSTIGKSNQPVHIECISFEYHPQQQLQQQQQQQQHYHQHMNGTTKLPQRVRKISNESDSSYNIPNANASKMNYIPSIQRGRADTVPIHNMMTTQQMVDMVSQQHPSLPQQPQQHPQSLPQHQHQSISSQPHQQSLPQHQHQPIQQPLPQQQQPPPQLPAPMLVASGATTGTTPILSYHMPHHHHSILPQQSTSHSHIPINNMTYPGLNALNPSQGSAVAGAPSITPTPTHYPMVMSQNVQRQFLVGGGPTTQSQQQQQQQSQQYFTIQSDGTYYATPALINPVVNQQALASQFDPRFTSAQQYIPQTMYSSTSPHPNSQLMMSTSTLPTGNTLKDLAPPISDYDNHIANVNMSDMLINLDHSSMSNISTKNHAIATTGAPQLSSIPPISLSSSTALSNSTITTITSTNSSITPSTTTNITPQLSSTITSLSSTTTHATTIQQSTVNTVTTSTTTNVPCEKAVGRFIIKPVHES